MRNSPRSSLKLRSMRSASVSSRSILSGPLEVVAMSGPLPQRAPAEPAESLPLEGRQHDSLLLLAMRGRVALAWAGSLQAADVAELDALGQDLGYAPPHDAPGTHVPGLLLRPDHLLEVRIALDQGCELVAGERVQQLDPRDGHRLGLVATVVAVDVVVDLAAAQHQPLDALLAILRARVVEHEVESPGGQVLPPRGGARESQETLRSEDDQRPRLGDARLAPEQVEVLRCGAGVGKTD